MKKSFRFPIFSLPFLLTALLFLIFRPDQTPEPITPAELENHLRQNLTAIITENTDLVPANGQWFIDEFELTAPGKARVLFEDGHFLHEALIECEKAPQIECGVLSLNDTP